jgi:hypothetical protein
VSHLVIGQVSQHLRHTLWLGLKDDTITGQLVTAEANIVLSNPADPVTATVVRQASLWLYQVLPNEHLRNAPPVRKRDAIDDTAEVYPPLAINLLYLLTPSTGSDLGDQQVLGRALQVFHEQSILLLQSTQPPNNTDELHVSLAPRTIEELAQVWEALQQPYRLSVCYEVRVARIDSLRKQQGGRVRDRVSQFSSMAA